MTGHASTRRVRCPHTTRYNDDPPFRCEKNAGHKGVHMARTPTGGIAWPNMPESWWQGKDARDA